MDSREIHSSETRKKVDCINPIDNLSWNECLEQDEREGSKCDLRKSLAWDSAFFTSPGVFDVEELFASLNLRENDLHFDLKGKCTNGELPSTSNECTGRTSIAWNSAFFTDPGVLDAEELFLVNSGISNTTFQKLPENNKQLWRSVDASTSRGSRYSVTSIDCDLFDDLRTALHRSTARQNAMSASGKRDGIHEFQFSQESDAASARKMLKPLPPPGRQRTNVHRQKRVVKEPSRFIPQPLRVVCNGETTPSPSQKPDKFMCGSGATVAVSTNKSLSPLEHAKPKNTTGRNMNTLTNRCSEEQTAFTPTVRSSCPTGFRRVVDPKFTASDSSFKTPSRRVSEKNRKTPTKVSTPLSDIALKDFRSSGLRLPLPKIRYFNSENAEKENTEPNLITNTESASKRRYRSSPHMDSPAKRPSPLGRRKSETHSANGKAKCSKLEGKSKMGTKKTDIKTHRNRDVIIEF